MTVCPRKGLERAGCQRVGSPVVQTVGNWLLKPVITSASLRTTHQMARLPPVASSSPAGKNRAPPKVLACSPWPRRKLITSY